MLGKFALLLCPEPGCPKVGLAKGAKCPTHGVAMERTVVMTDAYVRANNSFAEIADMARAFRGQS